MRKLGIVVYVDVEIKAWLDEKSRRGYKKASLIRHILRKQMEYEKRERPKQPELGQVAALR